MKAYQKNNLFKNELQVDGKLYEKLPSDVYIALHENMFYKLHSRLSNISSNINTQLKEDYAFKKI
jgi:hypothetical protein